MYTLLSLWEFLPWEIWVAFPEESQLQQSRATQPSFFSFFHFECVDKAFAVVVCTVMMQDTDILSALSTGHQEAQVMVMMVIVHLSLTHLMCTSC